MPFSRQGRHILAALTADDAAPLGLFGLQEFAHGYKDAGPTGLKRQMKGQAIYRFCEFREFLYRIPDGKSLSNENLGFPAQYSLSRGV